MVNYSRLRKRSWVSATFFCAVFAFSTSVAVFSLVPSRVTACAFDMVKPERTQIDWILDAETLVLARSEETNPFVFAVERVIFGEEERPPIDQLVDGITRRKLAANSSDAVLFAYLSETGWHRVAFVDNSFRDVLNTALEHRSSWQTGIPQSRLDFITSLQDSSVPSHRRIVIGELDKVPYRDLQKFDLRISDHEVLAELWSQTGYPYQAIGALLLGLSGTQAARDEVHSYISRVVDWPQANNLGAFSAALIELDGVSGVEWLAEAMLLDPKQPLEKVEQIVMALSVHYGLADPQLEATIQKVIQTLVSQRAEAGAAVARQFTLRADWSQSAVLEPLVRERQVALSDLLTISVYLAQAREDVSTNTQTVIE